MARHSRTLPPSELKERTPSPPRREVTFPRNRFEHQNRIKKSISIRSMCRLILAYFEDHSHNPLCFDFPSCMQREDISLKNMNLPLWEHKINEVTMLTIFPGIYLTFRNISGLFYLFPELPSTILEHFTLPSRSGNLYSITDPLNPESFTNLRSIMSPRLKPYLFCLLISDGDSSLVCIENLYETP